ncbi:MAG: hypothetical protein ABL970_13005 [Nitrospira sp.]
MITYYHAIRDVARHIADAIDYSVEALREGRVEQEPAMTDRMLGSIEQSLEEFHTRGIRWSAKTLTDRGRGSQESRFGADFMGVLNIALPDFKVSKGFLAQAKLVRNGRVDNLRDLKQQCERMLTLSPDSFVFLYGYDGVRVVPAISVVASNVDPLGLYNRSAQRFFEEHLQCFIGDGAIQAATPAMLEILRRRYEARSAMLLLGGESEINSPPLRVKK